MKMKSLILALSLSVAACASASTKPKYYVRYDHQGRTQYGELIGKMIQPLAGGLFDERKAIGKPLSLNDVTLRLPTDAQKVFAVGMNFASHMSSAADAPPPLFLKLPTSLTTSDTKITLPSDATNVHFEGEHW